MTNRGNPKTNPMNSNRQATTTAYQRGLKWIAINDRPQYDDVYDIAALESVHALASAFSKDPYEVAEDVARIRSVVDVTP